MTGRDWLAKSGLPALALVTVLVALSHLLFAFPRWY